MPSSPRRNSGLSGALFSALVLVGAPGQLHAEDAGTSAREHFNRGYAFAEKGDPHSAIREFELAYATNPNASVLYNLGQAYAAAGRSSEAIETLERYLSLSGANVPAARLAQINAQLQFHAQRVGKLFIEVEPPSAEIWLDGKSLGVGSRVALLSPGKHHLIATAPGFELGTAEPQIEAKAETKLVLRLESRALPAHLSISCPLEEVAVFVDGIPRGRTPALTGLALASGSHQVKFQRAGYVSDEQRVDLRPESVSRVSCRLTLDPRDSTRGRLLVRHPVGTTVFLDGAPFRGSPVAVGSHQLRVEGPGYVPETRRIVLTPRQALEFTLRPAQSREHRDLERRRRHEILRTWSYVFAGLSLASGATALIIYIDNSARYEAWQARGQNRIKTIASDQNPLQSMDNLLAEENDIRRRDNVALGLAVFSGAALAAGTILYLSSRDSVDRLVLSGSAAPELRYVRSF
jgi:hypothetical protein